ncbi:hypothetical protein COOONC_12993 [Cooperia oncophora]
MSDQSTPFVVEVLSWQNTTTDFLSLILDTDREKAFNANRELRLWRSEIPTNALETRLRRSQNGLVPANISSEGLDEVFEGAFEIGHKYALEQLRGSHQKLAQLQETESEKPGCITQ